MRYDYARIGTFLESLVGVPLSGLGRVLSMGVFNYGNQVSRADGSTEQIESGSEFALHVQCPFRLIRGGVIVLGSVDMHTYATPDAEGDRQSIYDLKAALIDRGVQQSPAFVVAAFVNEPGDLRVEMTDDLALEVFPADSVGRESWRLLRRFGEHVVLP